MRVLRMYSCFYFAKCLMYYGVVVSKLITFMLSACRLRTLLMHRALKFDSLLKTIID